MGTHPIFESDFDCLTDLARCKIQHTKMADAIDDALASYLTDKYAQDENDENMREIDDLPDSASVGGSDASMSSSSESEAEEAESDSSSDADTVIDEKRATSESDRIRRKKRREE